MTQQYSNIKSKLLFTFLFAGLLFFIAKLFYGFTLIPELFNSDYDDHIKFTINFNEAYSKSYSLMHVLIKVFGDGLNLIIPNEYKSYSYAMIFINLAALIFTSTLIFKILIKHSKSLWLTILITTSISFISMLFFDINIEPVYLGTGTSNPWHNPTFNISKPFSILVFFSIIKFWQNTENKINANLKDYILIALFSTICMAIKPSFLISFLPTIAIVFIGLQIKKVISTKTLLTLGSFLALSLIPIFIIYSMIYGVDKPDGGIAFQTGEVWRVWSKNIPVSILKAIAFPLFITLFYWKHINKSVFLAIINITIAIIIAYFITETGYRANHGNFFWTYLFGIFFFFLTTLELFFFKIKHTNKILYIIGILLFSSHLICGIIYFINQLLGNDYM